MLVIEGSQGEGGGRASVTIEPNVGLAPLDLPDRGRFTTLAPTRHTTTNADIIQRFLDVPIAVAQLERDVWEVRAG